MQFEHFKLWRLYHSTCIDINDHSTHWQCYINIFSGSCSKFCIICILYGHRFQYIGVSNWAFFFTLLINSMNELIGQFYLHLTSTSSGVATLKHCKHMLTNIFCSFWKFKWLFFRRKFWYCFAFVLELFLKHSELAPIHCLTVGHVITFK